jgi:hypothetical protein
VGCVKVSQLLKQVAMLKKGKDGGKMKACISIILLKGTYHIYMGSSCIYRAYELIKFTKKSKKIYTCSFHPTLSVYKISRLN